MIHERLYCSLSSHPEYWAMVIQTSILKAGLWLPESPKTAAEFSNSGKKT
jgi:hypothetical protein